MDLVEDYVESEIESLINDSVMEREAAGEWEEEEED